MQICIFYVLYVDLSVWTEDFINLHSLSRERLFIHVTEIWLLQMLLIYACGLMMEPDMCLCGFKGPHCTTPQKQFNKNESSHILWAYLRHQMISNSKRKTVDLKSCEMNLSNLYFSSILDQRIPRYWSSNRGRMRVSLECWKTSRSCQKRSKGRSVHPLNFLFSDSTVKPVYQGHPGETESGHIRQVAFLGRWYNTYFFLKRDKIHGHNMVTVGGLSWEVATGTETGRTEFFLWHYLN